MPRRPFAEWRISEKEFPADGSEDEKLKFLLRYAILAPSSHNTQPWLFRIGGGRVDVLADRTRRLPIVDPHDRALIISCGAALELFRVAARHFGYETDIHLLPKSDDADLMARAVLRLAGPRTEQEEKLFQAILRRRSTRLPFEREPLPPHLPSRLVALASEESVAAAIITDGETKSRIGALIAEGDRRQFADRAFRRELAFWVRSRRSASRDGISGSNFGMPDILSAAGGLAIRTFDMGEGVAAKDEEIARRSPALLIVTTEGDEPSDWIRAGIAHARMLLEVTASGLTAAYLNQPIEVESLRGALRKIVDMTGVPQLLLRIGRAPEISPAVRRPLADVLLG